ncbi:hypothetical protein LTS14_004417 [Recurvomyces mirabilis]|uniref:uncharacterized protein n=1 Tax=Recurvomyces mirabilis TaxID=574656 RepID=UPI002DDDDE84|nr:hypothetical protein LTS14_004417 [Recurvomyces mirabilis]
MQAEDYDDDTGAVRPGTAQTATRRQLSSRPPPKVTQRRADSDSGYSSHTSAPPGALAVQNIVATSNATRRPAGSSPSKSTSAVQWRESQSARPQAPCRSASVSRVCADLNCGHSSCASRRNPERRFTFASRVDAAQYAAVLAEQQRQAQLARQPGPYIAPIQTTPLPAAPVMSSQPRPVPTPLTRSARPVSVYGYANVSGYVQPGQYVPPHSPSGYHNFPATYYPQYQPPAAGIYGTTPPNQIMPQYAQASPIMQSPGTVQYTAAPALNRTYSARDITPTAVNYATPVAAPVQPMTRRLSARQPASMPGTFPGAEEGETEDSESDYDSEAEREARREADRERRRRARDSKMMPPPVLRRPSLSTRNTTSAATSRRVSREPIKRNPRSDTDFDYPSSDQVDSDRTTRADIYRPTTTDSSYSGRSRRPSISTTASSGRTRATTVSDRSGLSRREVIIEDRHGRRSEYLSKNEYNDLVRRYEQQKLEDIEVQDRAERYQQQIRGRQVPELTAENIKQLSERRTSGSHISGHSRKSSQSAQAAKDGGIRIESNGTVLHVYGDARVEMKPGEDGKNAIIIGSSSGRDSAYHGSRSSGSRISKRKDTITEEYEDRL